MRNVVIQTPVICRLSSEKRWSTEYQEGGGGVENTLNFPLFDTNAANYYLKILRNMLHNLNYAGVYRKQNFVQVVFYRWNIYFSN